MSALDELAKLAAPPQDAPPYTPDWETVQRKFKVESLPSDYKALVERYGAGNFGEFINLLAPDWGNANLDLVAQAGDQLKELRRRRDEAGVKAPIRAGSADGGGLPFAYTDNGDVIWWSMGELAKPDAWTVLVMDSDALDWEPFDGSTTEFLVAALSGKTSFTSFPDGFPPPRPTFEPL